MVDSGGETPWEDGFQILMTPMTDEPKENVKGGRDKFRKQRWALPPRRDIAV